MFFVQSDILGIKTYPTSDTNVAFISIPLLTPMLQFMYPTSHNNVVVIPIIPMLGFILLTQDVICNLWVFQICVLA